MFKMGKSKNEKAWKGEYTENKKLNLLVVDHFFQADNEKLNNSLDVESVNVAQNEEQIRKFLRKEGEFNKAPSPDIIIFDLEPIVKSKITS